jgi:hypothetical protein
VPVRRAGLLDDAAVGAAGVAHGRHGEAGQQRRADPVADRVANRHRQPVRADRVVEVVPADLVSGLHGAGDGERGQLKGQAGQQLPLDLRREPEFAAAPQHLEPVGVAACPGQHMPQHPRDVVEDLPHLRARVMAGQGNGEDSQALGAD